MPAFLFPSLAAVAGLLNVRWLHCRGVYEGMQHEAWALPFLAAAALAGLLNVREPVRLGELYSEHRRNQDLL